MATTNLGAGEIYDYNVATDAAINFTKILQRTNARHPVNFALLRVWDALGTNLPATPASDDLGLVTGTFASAASYVGTGDVKAAGTTTRYARFFVPIPPTFQGGQETITVRLIAGMKTTIADTSAVADVEAWRLDTDGTLGAADLCTQAAQSINSLTAASKDFNIDPTTLAGGDVLDVRLTITVVDAATVTAVIAALWQIELQADLR